MEHNNNEVFITPDYITKFRCIGKNCIDSCCTGFNIELDKETYKKYINSTDKKINLISKKYLVKNKAESNLSYGKIENKNHSCPFLANDKLCNAYSLLGKESLSIGCSTYPRIFKKFKGITFLAGEISCPEIARLCLRKSNVEIKKLKKNKLKNIFNSNKVFSFDIPEDLPVNIKNLIENIFLKLSNKDTIFKNLEEIIISYYNIHNKIDYFPRSNAFKSEKKKLKENNLLLQSKFLPKICFRKNSDNYLRYQRICTEAAEKSKYFCLTENEFKNKYIYFYKNKLNKFSLENNYVLKNFFLNEFIKNIDGLHLRLDFFDGFIREVLYKISIANFLITCLAFEDTKNIVLDDYIKVLSAIQKVTQNSEEKKTLVINFFRKLDSNNLFLRLFDVY
jgi:lysine-N-methylase